MADKNAGRRVMAMHQPNYIPWLGYFHKLAHADVFVILDAVQYPRGRTVSARNEIKTPQGRAMLTVPVSVPGGRDGKATYGEVQFADQKWRQKHLRTLELNYRKAPFFDEVHPFVTGRVQNAASLLELNLGLIEDIADFLRIGTERVPMSALGDDLGHKTDLIVELCRLTGCDVYLSGTGGGREYNDEVQLRAAGIALEYSDFEPEPYTQLWGAFEPRLSSLDALYNLGRGTRSLLGLE